MSAIYTKRTKCPQYKYVSRVERSGAVHYATTIHGLGHKKYNTARDAAKSVDLFLIRNGKQPVNVLKPNPIGQG